MLVEKRARHYPVMAEKVVNLLVWNKRGVYIDLTFGGGGHSRLILENLSDNAKLFVVDLDKEAFKKAIELEKNDKRVKAINGNFSNLEKIWQEHIAPLKVDGVLADLGLSMYLIRNSGKGFTFQKNEPLDMRYGDGGVTAEIIVNTYSFKELKRIFTEYGEERKAEMIVKKIIEVRRKEKIRTTKQLVDIVEEIKGKGGRLNPATKIFQALRIEVNNELGNLMKMLDSLPLIMSNGGRSVIISYHSLEDRIVKNRFLDWEHRKKGKRLNKKVIVADKREITINPPSRSAKLRAFKFGGENE